MISEPFTADRTSRTATIVLNGSVDIVFPLFEPLEEKKWEDKWDPVILYPVSGRTEEGMVFTTPAQDKHEVVYTWIVSKFNPDLRLIEYIVSTYHRVWIISVGCEALSDIQTRATIRYTYTSLTPLGNTLNKQAIMKMYERDLKDWEEAINHYLKTGLPLKRE
jgi:hypothetical protein